MSFIEEIWERNMDWHSGLEKRDDGEDDESDDDEDEDKSSTSTPQTRTQTTSSTNSAISVGSTFSQTKTSGSSTASVPNTSSTAKSSPNSSVSTTTIATKTTILTSVITTPASLSATQKGKGNASTTSNSTKASSTNTAVAQDISSPPKSSKPSKTTINIAIGVTVLGLLLIALLLFIFRRRIFRKKKSSVSNATRSIWGERSSIAETAPNAPQAIYIPPITMRRNRTLMSPLAMNPNIRGESMLSRDGMERQQRLARVRTDLLGKRELKTGLTRKPVPDTEIRGDIGMARGSGIVDEKHRVEIEASAEMWEDPVTIVRRGSVGESEASLPRWRTPVSWVRDQRMRGWGRLSGWNIPRAVLGENSYC
ncbi:hypothetical protein N431DRAFT_479773 [Stipitochalara longipes BDJ]|nr:hypothetical protein N431DRAFT_479773 [Stipitochalara longipes BDJ]